MTFGYIVCYRFKKLCEEAFLKLRESGPLFLNLFTMMMSCGIPELQNRDDISYIRYMYMHRLGGGVCVLKLKYGNMAQNYGTVVSTVFYL